MTDGPLVIVEPGHLQDATDWRNVDSLISAYAYGGIAALSDAYDELIQDPARALRVLAAFYPDDVRTVIREEMAVLGITEAELRRRAGRA